ncbi:hypothetical protein BKA80DRAFT_264446 [Phyllosticta citrichinensis]
MQHSAANQPTNQQPISPELPMRVPATPPPLPSHNQHQRQNDAKETTSLRSRGRMRQSACRRHFFAFGVDV